MIGFANHEGPATTGVRERIKAGGSRPRAAGTGPGRSESQTANRREVSAPGQETATARTRYGEAPVESKLLVRAAIRTRMEITPKRNPKAATPDF
jgi:hypothetical protein